MRLNTNGDIFPTGTYRFKIVDVPEKDQTAAGYAFYQFKFLTTVDGEEMPYSERFMVWLMAPICRAIGFEELAPGEFEFEASWCLGKEIQATICHEKIEKGSSAGKVVARMKDVKPVDASMPPMHRAAMSAQSKIDDTIPF